MREIKFRTYYKPKKEWFNGVLMDQSGNYWICDDNNYFLPNPFGDDLVIMQNTGLKDKNGKEIYEGDICLHESGNGYFKEKDKIKIVADIPSIYITVFSSGIGEINEDTVEIIGNIYENPELLKYK